MQILGHQQQRRALCVAIEHFAHLAQHALRADAGQLLTECSTLLRATEPRQLHEPRRRDSAKQRRSSVAVTAAQFRERFEDGQMRLARTVLLYALTTDGNDIAESRNEPLDQRRLADARFAGNPHDYAFAGARKVPVRVKPGKRVAASDERCRLRRARLRTASEAAAEAAVVGAMNRYPRRDTGFDEARAGGHCP